MAKQEVEQKLVAFQKMKVETHFVPTLYGQLGLSKHYVAYIVIIPWCKLLYREDLFD